MMYIAGLTVREIAHWCRQHDNTVRLHLQIREKYWPGFRSTHEAALAARGPARPTTAWRRRHAEATMFHIRNIRLPHHADTDERGLAAWITVQRTAYQQGQLSTPKIVLMGKIPGWNVSPRRRQLDEHWRSRLAELIAFTAATGSMPRWRRHNSEAERVLGVWLHTQHQARAEDTLPQWRLDALDTAFPAWASRM